MMAERTRHREAAGTIADRAAADRTWQFGHVIVDEAQELSPMEWRMLMRRCHRRSMTLVGDLAQAGSDAGVRSWADLLDQYAPGRWRTAELTVNYRTPAEIMAVAADVLTAIDPTATPPVSARSTEVAPWSRSVSADRARPGPARGGRRRAGRDRGRTPRGDRARIPVRRAHRPGLRRATRRGPRVGPDPAGRRHGDPHGRSVEGTRVRLGPDRRPGRDPAESARGGSDLYVAVTRATQRLGVIAVDALPDVLRRLGVSDRLRPDEPRPSADRMVDTSASP